jgi:chitodextrinase
MGARVVATNIGFPLLYSGFFEDPAKYEEYLSFYRRLATDIRAEGLQLVLITHFVVAERMPEVGPFYASLSVEEYRLARARQAVTIAQELRPDYLSVITEPDMEARLTGQPVGTAASSALLLDTILNELQTAGVTGVSIGAGIGNWTSGYREFIDSFASRNVQYIDIHVYSPNKGFLPNILEIADVAASYGKPIGISEVWMNKARDSELGTISQAVTNARNVFSFWEPLDTAYLQSIVNYSHYKRVEFMTAFWSSEFFRTLPYSSSLDSMHPNALYDLFVDEAEKALARAQSTSTGQAYAAMITDPPDVTPPNPPAGLAAETVCAASVRLSWIGSSDDIGVHGYRVFRDGVQVGTTHDPSFVDSGLDASSYQYSVDAYDFPGNFTLQIGASGTSFGDSSPPSRPLNLTGQVLSATRVALSWDASTDNNCVAFYRVFRGGKSIGEAPGPAFEDEDVKPATTYNYNVRAYDARGNTSLTSATFTVTTAPDTTAPSTPISISAVPVPPPAIQLYVTWVPSTDDVAVSGYRLYRDGLELADVQGLKYLDVNVEAGRSYSYAVAAYDAAGNISPASAPAIGTSSDTVAPSTPENVSVSVVSAERIDLMWSPSNDNVAVTGYRVYRSGSEIGSVSGTAFSDASLIPGTSYSYAVAAYDAAGNQSPQSVPAEGTTPKLPDTTLPQVFVAAPAPGAALSGSVPLTAYAADPNVATQIVSGIAGVALKIDGVTIGPEDTVAPYNRLLDTRTYSNGSHVLTAVARDNAGNQKTSAAVSVTINNP